MAKLTKIILMKQHLWAILIVLSALALRLIYLGKTPPGLYWDEVSLGYNAYSILKIGRDEHGEFLPVASFKAFGDYKPPAYIYATVPSLALFGLNQFAVRFPSALAGTLTVLFTYWLVKELFPKQKSYSLFTFHFSLADIAALLLAISPWHLQLSRVAFESTLAALFNLLAIYFFLKSLKRPWLLSLSSVFFVATLYTFNANRLLSLLLVLLLTLIFFRHLLKHKKPALVAALIGLVLTAPLVPHLRSAEGKLRWHEVNIFSDLKVILRSNQRIQSDGGGRLAKLIHHRYFGHIRNFLSHYFDHFDGRYLFLKGDVNPRFSVQDVGELYLINLPFLLIGIYALAKGKNRQARWLLLGWFLLGPIPAATARETPHALRSLSTLPSPQILIALGLVYSLKQLKKSTTLVLAAYSLLLALSFAYFQISYYRYHHLEFAGEWLTSYPRLVKFLQTSAEAQSANKITIVPDLGRPYIYFLFYNRYPPDKYLQTVDRSRDAFGFYKVWGFDKYEFKRTQPQDIQSGDIFVARASEKYPGFESLQKISEINGFEQFNVLKKL